jgi:hypothetical protein
MRRFFFLLLMVGCGGGGGGATEACTSSTCALGGKAYKFCGTPGGSSCKYVGSDGKEYKCASCENCAQAAQEIATWCTAGATTSTTGATTSTTGTTGSTTSGTGNTGSTTSGTGSTTSGTGNTTGNVTGSTTSSGGTSGGPPDACNTCFQAVQEANGACSSQLAACVADTGCSALLDCTNNCAATDNTCVTNCISAQPMTAYTLLAAVYSCGCSACSSPCAGECSSSSSSSSTSSSTTSSTSSSTSSSTGTGGTGCGSCGGCETFNGGAGDVTCCYYCDGNTCQSSCS